MTTQNPAPTATNPVSDRRVQPDGPLSGEVQRGGELPAVVFKSVAAAEHFVRAITYGRPGPGCGFWTADQWMARAQRIANETIAREVKPWQQPGLERVAMFMRTYKGGKGASFRGVRCDCCGTVLTAPESVLAGRGPKCMEDGKRPVAAQP